MTDLPPDTATLLVATTNPGKLAEVRALLAQVRIKILGLDEYPPWPEPVEDADDFEGNAKLKALYYARLVDGWALADDSGLEVDALAGQPGVHSARFAGARRDDHANNRKLIALLADVPAERRTARYRCVMALANPKAVQTTASGELRGLIQNEPLGENGFGYDPYFFVPSEAMTAAQLAPERKNQISHRGQALRRIIPAIQRFVVA